MKHVRANGTRFPGLSLFRQNKALESTSGAETDTDENHLDSATDPDASHDKESEEVNALAHVPAQHSTFGESDEKSETNTDIDSDEDEGYTAPEDEDPKETARHLYSLRSRP